LLDVNMPGEDGLSVARELRRTHPAVGIVMLTANDDRCRRLCRQAR
jgi:DNA-binding response OmpR family regulator